MPASAPATKTRRFIIEALQKARCACRYNGSMSEKLTIAGREFSSRLIVGTGKYRSFEEMMRCHKASGADMVTVAVRRVNLTDRTKESLIDYIDRTKIFILPNTAGCYTADDAVRTAMLGREVGLSNWVKLEVIGDEKTLFPDNAGLLEATRILVKEGFVVLPYTNDDVVNARKLIDAGAAAVMPLAAPIGSGLGVQKPANLRIMRERITPVPMIVDAGVGTASDAYQQQGIPIYAVSMQNEPLNSTSGYPSAYVAPSDEANFIGNYLGPALAGAGLESIKNFGYEHNWDNPQYPEALLADSTAYGYLAGSSFHCYAGGVSAQSQVKQAYPAKDIWFTECSGTVGSSFAGDLAWNAENLLIGATRNWARGVTLWNIALDRDSGPQNGGCNACRGVVTVDGSVSPPQITRNVEYYVLGHLGK